MSFAVSMKKTLFVIKNFLIFFYVILIVINSTTSNSLKEKENEKLINPNISVFTRKEKYEYYRELTLKLSDNRVDIEDTENSGFICLALKDIQPYEPFFKLRISDSICTHEVFPFKFEIIDLMNKYGQFIQEKKTNPGFYSKNYKPEWGERANHLLVFHLLYLDNYEIIGEKFLELSRKENLLHYISQPRENQIKYLKSLRGYRFYSFEKWETTEKELLYSLGIKDDESDYIRNFFEFMKKNMKNHKYLGSTFYPLMNLKSYLFWLSISVTRNFGVGPPELKKTLGVDENFNIGGERNEYFTKNVFGKNLFSLFLLILIEKVIFIIVFYLFLIYVIILICLKG